MKSLDTISTSAMYRAAKGLREGDGAQGQELANLIRSGAPIDDDVREMLALLVTDRLLWPRNSRPPGETHPWHVQAGAAVEYLDRTASAPHGHAKAIKHDIADRLGKGSGIATVGRWVTEYRSNVAALDALMEQRAALDVDGLIDRLTVQDRIGRAALVRTHRERFVAKRIALYRRLGRDGETLMRQTIAQSSK